MNRLKHILGVNVPRRVPSMKKSHGTGINHPAQFHPGNARLISKGSKTICKQRSRVKCSVMSLKKSSLESVARGTRHYSTQQNVKFNGNGTGKRRVLQTMMTNNASHANRGNSFVASVKRQPRSYAEMIADYSEAIRTASAAATRNDNSYFSNSVRKSPFSTLTVPPLDKRMMNIAKRSGVSSKARENHSADQFRGISDAFHPFYRSIRSDSTNNVEATNRNYAQFTAAESKSEDRSYAKLVADCSKSAHIISVASNSALTPRPNMLAKSSLESFTTSMRNASSTNNSQRIARKASGVVETSRQSSTQVSTSTFKQPQVELHMVPSAKESVVSINVDSVSTRLSSPLKFTSEELSVVVRSNQKTAAASRSSDPPQWNAPTIRQSANSALRHRDFGPMRISISEDSAPIKQIEFSINGKPVSELKSIVARTERLDVVTSSDKIEIRVPFAKDDASAASRGRAEDEQRRRSDSSMEQILNVQISANFQNEPTKGSTELPHNAPKINTVPTPSPQAPATRSLLKGPAKVSSATFDNNDARQRGTFARTDTKADDTVKRQNNERRTSDGTRSSKAQRETTSKLSADKSATDVSTIERANKGNRESNTKAGKLHAKKITTSQYSEANKDGKDDESVDTRVPTNMIPWWSSSDGFNKMKKKKKHNYKPSDWSGNELSNTSTNNAIDATNNSNDMISYSLKQHKGLKSTIYYPSLFRLKSSRKNSDTTSKVMKCNSKVKTMPVMKKDSEKIASIKRTEPVTLSALETTNVKSKHDASEELDTHVKKASLLSRKFKAPKDTQESVLKQDRKKKSKYSLQETHSIDDVFSTKTKVKDILDNIKLLSKRKDDSLTDYDLKISSRKSTMKLNSGVKEIQDSVIMKAQDLISKKSRTEMTKTEQINEAEALKRTEWDKVEKSEVKKIMKDDSIVKNLLAPIDVKAWDEGLVKSMKESKQERSKSLSSVSALKTTEIQKSGKLNSLKSLELNDTRHLSKGLVEKLAKQEKKSLPTANTKLSSQKKSNLTSKIKDHNPFTDSTEKNLGAVPFTHRPADKLAKTIRNPAKSANFSKKPNRLSAGIKSADSKMRTRTDVKLSESRANFNRSQPSVIASVSPWTHMDRPEKSALYSAWLQRFKNDVDKYKKLF